MRSTIIVKIAGNMPGTCMKGGKIELKKSGDETGSSMNGGEIIADEIKSIGNTIKGKIIVRQVGNSSRS